MNTISNMIDKNGNPLKIGNSVFVNTDFNYEVNDFLGTVVGTRNGDMQVEDQDGDVFEVCSDDIELYEED